MDDDERWEQDLWSERTRTEFLMQGEAAISTLREHMAFVAAAQGEDDEPRIDASAESLRTAYIALSNAEFNYSSTVGPFSMLEFESEDDEDEDDEPLDEDAEYNQVSLMLRRDYRITSESALLAAGRSAYGQVWPEDSAEAAAEDVQDVGRAIYQIIHARGLEELNDVDGITATAGVMLTIGREELVSTAELELALDDPSEMFVVDGDVIFSQTDIW